jgi:hypothetical protein
MRVEGPPIEDAFARVEAAVDAGDTDLSRLRFWSLVRRVKVDPSLAERWADVVGRIDRKAFEARVHPRFPVWLGTTVLLAGAAVLVAAVVLAVRVARGDPGSAVAGLLLVAGGGGLSVALHAPAHWVAGRLAGIRFLHCYLDGPTRIQPGLKIDYASYLRAAPGARAAMHAAGAVASKIAPFVVFAAAYLPHRGAGYDLFPAWSLWVVLGIGVLQLVTDALYSTKHADWKKVRREWGVATARRTGPTPDARR